MYLELCTLFTSLCLYYSDSILLFPYCIRAILAEYSGAVLGVLSALLYGRRGHVWKKVALLNMLGPRANFTSLDCRFMSIEYHEP